MDVRFGRRIFLSAAGSFLASTALAEAPTGAIRPKARPDPALAPSVAPAKDMRPRPRPSAQSLIDEADLGGVVGFVVADATSGQEIENIQAATTLPPASVTKVVTSLYALEVLGADYRFATRILATAPMIDGKVSGDLVLVGGGDPALLTDDLAELAKLLAAAGLKQVDGRFLYWQGALPFMAEIEPGQPDHLGYNPAVSGLNLNFNRVYFEWKRQSGGDYRVTMDARSDLYRPAVSMAQIRVVDRAAPIFGYQLDQGRDSWTVSRQALREAGGRWLPVRYPGQYTAEVFQAFARDHGINLSNPQEVETLPQGVELARWTSAPLTDIIRDLLYHSTNLTAEVVGLAATGKRLDRQIGQRVSAREMALWCLGRTGVAARFLDHSGLHGDTRISARAMVRLLLADGAQGALLPLLKKIDMTDPDGRKIEGWGIEVAAKTGTLNFVSALAGYERAANGKLLAFAIFSGNLERRAETSDYAEDLPPGAGPWNARARRLQQQLLQRWGKIT